MLLLECFFSLWPMSRSTLTTGSSGEDCLQLLRFFLPSSRWGWFKKKTLVIATLDSEDEIFVVYIMSLAISDSSLVHFFYRAKIVFLQVDETSTTILPKYPEFPNVLFFKQILELLKYIEINNHALNPINGKQPSYMSIYSLEPI